MRRAFLFSLIAALAASAQQPPRPPQFVSPELLQDNRVAFRIHAPQATTVALMGGDIQNLPKEGLKFTKAENGVWEAITVDPIPPGYYRYRFIVNGVAVNDPRNPQVSESNTNTWSLFHVPGAAWMDPGKTPHGAVARIPYFSSSLNRYRRLHVYTPPGYELGKGKYPVFYLLHGASDCDDAWTSIGRAGIILDNLIAQGKAKPMIVVMPAGHTSTSMGGIRAATPGPDEFNRDFNQDVVPLIEKNYRVLKGRQNRAVAGLSMGGMQTLNIAAYNLAGYAYIGVFSSGVFGIVARNNQPANTDWEKQHAATLDDPKLKQGLKLLWLGTGKDDFLLETSRATVEMLKKHGFTPVYRETAGAHTWIVWREYLNEFAPQLFR